MSPITKNNDTTSSVLWSIHVLAPYVLVKDVNTEREDVENDLSYFITTLSNGERMATEWNPELRLGIKKAIDTIPNVYRQAWHYIGLDSVDRVLDEIVATELDHSSSIVQSKIRNVKIKPVVLNFSDGMEIDHWPGISVIHGLEKRQLTFTGANSTLYHLDSDKALMKRHLVKSRTPTPGYYDIYPHSEYEIDGTNEQQEEGGEEEEARKANTLKELSKLRFPLLIKPANSSSSRGISVKSIVDTPEEAYEQAMETRRVWGHVYAEEYITGREFTVLVSGSRETRIKVYKVLERVFRSQIPERERLLTHEMKWGDNNYGSNGNVETASWWMQICSDADQERLQPLAMAIYASFGGNGYCRMDLREDQRSNEVFVVDVNANCSIDEDEDTAMGKILKASGLTLGQFFLILMEDAILAQENLEAKASDHINLEFLPAAVAMNIGDGGIKHTIDPGF
ncbi:hypothetical protein BGZ80_006869 [Entomortierella chlamydospora]|uniref:ATP-grasp domain-containing protein n=1 Tax=Entomortierella chlamydospora TaxID=101097 RepID=A0A9P6MYU9_9FUNG|nr:hypothetical protein BGZ79_006455 [Entomortierella chlamydospora]KAG0018683.1 hypothetical protein BGZ80_006869 [Entomortierella chlamydospora]